MTVCMGVFTYDHCFKASAYNDDHAMKCIQHFLKVIRGITSKYQQNIWLYGIMSTLTIVRCAWANNRELA